MRAAVGKPMRFSLKRGRWSRNLNGRRSDRDGNPDVRRKCERGQKRADPCTVVVAEAATLPKVVCEKIQFRLFQIPGDHVGARRPFYDRGKRGEGGDLNVQAD